MTPCKRGGKIVDGTRAGGARITPLGGAAKRAVDICVSLLGLIFLAPVFLVIGVLIRLDSPGPVFFRQRRVGRMGRLFEIYKFRTMVHGAYKMGSRLTVKRDPRVTRLGKFLRWSKLDELPQLINVLRGDMSLVGPRPEDPYFVAYYSSEEREVLSVRPGIFGPSQIEGRDESEEYPDGLKDTEYYYIHHIMPAKLKRDLAYVRSQTLWGDMKFLLGGIWATVRGAFKARYLWERRRRIALMGVDLGAAMAAYLLALAIRFDWEMPNARYVGSTLLLIAIVRPLCAVYFGVYQSLMRYFGMWDYLTLAKAVTAGSIIVPAATYFLGMQYHPRSVFVIDWALVLLFWGGERVALRAWLRHRRQGAFAPKLRALIVGTGLGGEQMCRALLDEPLSAYVPVGFIDEQADCWGSRIHGIRVLGGTAELPLSLSARKVDVVFLCLSDVDEQVAQEVLAICARQGVEVRVVPALDRLVVGSEGGNGYGAAREARLGSVSVPLPQ